MTRVAALLVTEEDLKSETYGGYSLSFVLDDIGTKLTPFVLAARGAVSPQSPAQRWTSRYTGPPSETA